MFIKYSLLLLCVLSLAGAQFRNVFDDELYERVLDEELCDEQLRFLMTNISALPFFDAGMRFPRGILKLNLQDWGNFHQCLEISRDTGVVGTVEGKYCSINIPLQLNIGLLSSIDGSVENLELDEVTLKNFETLEKFKRQLDSITGLSHPDSELGGLEPSLNLAMCIPKVCTSRQVIDFASLTPIRIFNATENFCRLPNDKPFVAADYVAMAFCGVFGILITLSTSYDIYHNVINERNRKDRTNTLCCSFSLYTNTRRLLTFSDSPNALHCIDGIRSIAMLWVVVGHVYAACAEFTSNPLSAITWLGNMESVWLKSAHITVDTFFLLSGLLVVYSTVGKLSQLLRVYMSQHPPARSGSGTTPLLNSCRFLSPTPGLLGIASSVGYIGKFLKNIHMYYILRYLRLFPLLAAAILFQSSFVHHMADGPTWNIVAGMVQLCRDSWWWPLLYVSNYLQPNAMCLGVVWYLCVDMQLFWVSPLILVWVLGDSRRIAWLALGIALFMSLLSTSLYSFIYLFPSTVLSIGDVEGLQEYFKLYYINTLTRGGPFFVGMIFGYILHVYRGRKVKLNKPEYDNPIFDAFLNSYYRSMWALGLGWVIFACAHGYGGPINWFLSLNMWKLPARLSYAMYLLHMPMVLICLGGLVHQLHFSAASVFYRFMADTVLTFIVSFIFTLAIDSPFSTLQKLLLGDGPKKSNPEIKKPIVENMEKATSNISG